jgi:CDP-6-deoxy-D-xylo-4-hexulose-3-dehydrase
MRSPAELKAEILRLTREYSDQMHRANLPAELQNLPFEPGKTVIPYAGRVFTAEEVEAAVSSTLDFWLTLGPEGQAFERELAQLLGVRHSLLVNSGSSANLVALSALTTHKLPKERRIMPGDEVITVAAGFPTTVAPILQNGAVPVFIDNDPVTGNLRVDQLEPAYCEGKTKAVMLAHALGNPFDLSAVLAFCRKYNLWLIEDNCDALGCTYTMPEAEAKALGLDHLLKHAATGTHPLIRLEASANGERLLTAPTGSWGDLSTQSFYPPHHLTMGEGGAVNIVSKAALKSYAESFRDWGRDCWCASGKDDTCGNRFGWQLGELPAGYDHKYIYSHLGYNLKPLDPQAAIGRKQLKKLPAFIAARKRNWETLRTGLADLESVFEFTLPTHAARWLPAAQRTGAPSFAGNFAWSNATRRTAASWFGFMLRIRPTAPFSHTDLARYLDNRGIGNRMFFGGNLLRQPVFVQLQKDRPNAFRVIGEMSGADAIMTSAVFLGTYPGLSEPALKYITSSLYLFVEMTQTRTSAPKSLSRSQVQPDKCESL